MKAASADIQLDTLVFWQDHKSLKRTTVGIVIDVYPSSYGDYSVAKVMWSNSAISTYGFEQFNASPLLSVLVT